jgi:hypothetical protein
MAARVMRVGWPKRETPLGCLQAQQAPPLVMVSAV